MFRVALALLKVISLKLHDQLVPSPPPTTSPILASNEVGGACYTILHFKRSLGRTEKARRANGGECNLFVGCYHCHTRYYLHPFHFVLLKFEDLLAKQHPTNNVVVLYICSIFWYVKRFGVQSWSQTQNQSQCCVF